MSAIAIDAELLSAAHAEVGEGPCWDPRAGLLVWVDIMPGLIHLMAPDGEERSVIEVGRSVGAAIPRAGGGLVAAVADGFLLLDEAGEPQQHIEVEAEVRGNRMNDAKADPDGNVWAGTMALDFALAAGALYRLGPDLTVTTVLTSTTLANGLDWSPDGSTFYFIDSTTYRVDAFDMDPAGTIRNRRTVIRFTEADGMPDGMCVDSEGCLWIAFWGGGCVRRFAPSGEHLATISVPVPLVTSCCFGGQDVDELYVTTAAGIDEQLPPPAGGIYRAHPGVTGQHPRSFGA